MLELTKQKVTIQTVRDGPAEVDSECIAGLAIHKAYDGTRFWMVVHIKSGLAMPFTKLASRDAAVRCVEELLKLQPDWNISVEEINANKKLERKVKRLVRHNFN